MLYLTHPTADIMNSSMMFHFMKLRFENYGLKLRGSPWDCGYVDALMHHRYFNPRAFTIKYNGERSTKVRLEEEEYGEYTVSYRHAFVGQRIGPIGPRDLYPCWCIKGNELKWRPHESEILEPESGTETDSDSSYEPDSDSD